MLARASIAPDSSVFGRQPGLVERHERGPGRDVLGHDDRQLGLTGLGADDRPAAVDEPERGRIGRMHLDERLVLERRLQLVGPLGQAPFVDEQRIGEEHEPASPR